jgi:hypothetical protein
MSQPHRIEHDHPRQTPLNGNVQGLVVWIPGDLGGKPGLPGRFSREQRLGRAGTVAEQWRLRKESQGLLPVFEPPPGRARDILLILVVFDGNVRDPAA